MNNYIIGMIRIREHVQYIMYGNDVTNGKTRIVKHTNS